MAWSFCCVRWRKDNLPYAGRGVGDNNVNFARRIDYTVIFYAGIGCFLKDAARCSSDV